METRLLKIDELAQMLKVARPTLYGMVHARRIPYVKVGRLLRFDTKEIDLWLHRPEQNSP